MYSKFGIKNEILELSKEVENDCETQFKKIEKIKEINSLKVLSAFQKCGLSEMHLQSSTGYGIDEPGRNKIEEIYSEIFNTEDALVRSQLISGTHALAYIYYIIKKHVKRCVEVECGYTPTASRRWRELLWSMSWLRPRR